MLSFLDFRNSRLEMSFKKGVLKIKNLQNSLKNIRDRVFNLTKFQRIYLKETSRCALFVEQPQNATPKISSKFSEAAACRYFSKYVFFKILH